jgi:2-phospho-L-lactate/phosphoenolpyruvate guanylyltransferase
MRIAAILPLRGLADGKKRLAGMLPPALRQGVILALLDRVVTALRAVPEVATIAVVSPDTAALEHAAASGLTPLRQTSMGLNAGLDEAMRWAAMHGYDGALVVLPDLPLVTGDALGRVASPPNSLSIAMERGSGVILVQDRRGEGTNAMVQWPPSVMPCRFGVGSYAAHWAVAEELGIPVMTRTVPDLAFDLDLPRDVRDLALWHSLALARLMWEAWRRRPMLMGTQEIIPSMKEGRR